MYLVAIPEMEIVIVTSYLELLNKFLLNKGMLSCPNLKNVIVSVKGINSKCYKSCQSFLIVANMYTFHYHTIYRNLESLSFLP